MRDLKKNGLNVAVYSKDRFSSIFIGQVAFPLEQLFADEQPLSFEENNVSEAF
jgi:phosphatidylserine decarboxylase